jgi:hypothetical protein
MTDSLEYKIDSAEKVIAKLDEVFARNDEAAKKDVDTIILNYVANDIVNTKDLGHLPYIGQRFIEVYSKLNSHRKAITLESVDTLFNICLKFFKRVKFPENVSVEDVISLAKDNYVQAKADFLQGEAEEDLDNLDIKSAIKKLNRVCELQGEDKAQKIEDNLYAAGEALKNRKMRLFITHYGLAGESAVDYLRKTYFIPNDPCGYTFYSWVKESADSALDAFNEMLDLQKQNAPENKINCKSEDFDFLDRNFKLTDKLYKIIREMESNGS